MRYDGGDKRDDGLIGALGPFVVWVPVCPEVEAGMTVPREPVQLVGAPPRMLGVESGRDWTEVMTAWAAERLEGLGDLQGYVFKARSPSCGLAVAVQGEDAPGRGLFAAALTAAHPGLPVVCEDDLADEEARQRFLERLRNAGREGRQG